MRYRVLLVVALVVLAGCSGVFGGSSEPTATITPAAVPTDQPTPVPPPEFPPGVSKRGIEVPSVLIGAHGSFLENRSFTEKTNTTIVAPNGSVFVRSTGTLRVGPPGEGLRSVSENNGSFSTVASVAVPVRSETWQKGQRNLVKRTFRNGTATYTRWPGDGTRFGAATGRLRFLLSSIDTENATVSQPSTHDGTTVFRVRGPVRNGVPNATLSLLVDSRGFIHRYTEVRRFPSETNVSKSITRSRFVAVNATDPPERPSWVETALNRTTPTGFVGTTEGE